jgi:nitrogenase molybdenum-iron protein NifN
LDEIGVTPVIAATGAPGAKFKERIESVTKNCRVKPMIMPDTDFVTVLEACKEIPVDFLLGNSKGLYLARELKVPLVRCGFPIHDRLGGHRILHLGYRGTLNLFERICNALIEESQNEQKHGWTYV